jgi:hypothetical protein
VVAVAIGVWWVRGKFEERKRDGLQSIINGLEGQLDIAKDQQSYLEKRLADAGHFGGELEIQLSKAEPEIAKLKKQIEDRAAPELLRDTVNSTARIVGEIETVNTRLGNAVSNPDLFTRRLEIYKVVKNCVEQVVRNPGYFGGEVANQFFKAVDDADLFFGDDVHNYLETLREDIVKVHEASVLQDEARMSSPNVRVEWPMGAMIRINKFSEEGKPLFAKYMGWRAGLSNEVADSKRV